MTFVYLLVAIALVAVVGTLVMSQQFKRQAALMTRLSERFGLTTERERPLSFIPLLGGVETITSLSGRYASHDVRIRNYTTTTGVSERTTSRWVSAEVDVDGDAGPDFRLGGGEAPFSDRTAKLGLAMAKKMMPGGKETWDEASRPDAGTGHADFDAQTYVICDDPSLLSEALDQDLRERVLALVAGGGWIEFSAGTLRYTASVERGWDEALHDRIERATDLLCALAERLERAARWDDE